MKEENLEWSMVNKNSQEHVTENLRGTEATRTRYQTTAGVWTIVKFTPSHTQTALSYALMVLF